MAKLKRITKAEREYVYDFMCTNCGSIITLSKRESLQISYCPNCARSIETIWGISND